MKRLMFIAAALLVCGCDRNMNPFAEQPTIGSGTRSTTMACARTSGRYQQLFGVMSQVPPATLALRQLRKVRGYEPQGDREDSGNRGKEA